MLFPANKLPQIMKKKLLLFTIATCASIFANAQVRAYEAGDKSVALEINPLFNYVGNLFNDNVSNNLGITSAGLIYRRFKSPERALRVRGNFSYLQNSHTPPFPPVYTSTHETVNALVGIGPEYRKNIKKWSLYAGWEIIGSFSNRNFKNEYSEPITQNAILEFNAGALLSGGLGIIGGAEFFMGDVFFLGMEVSAAALAGYQLPSTSIIQEADSQGIYSPEKTEGEAGFYMSASSIGLVAFRAGVRF